VALGFIAGSASVVPLAAVIARTWLYSNHGNGMNGKLQCGLGGCSPQRQCYMSVVWWSLSSLGRREGVQQVWQMVEFIAVVLFFQA